MKFAFFWNFEFSFIRGQAGQKTEKKHQKIRYQIIRENFENSFLAVEKLEVFKNE
jgi:hypothetical protein